MKPKLYACLLGIAALFAVNNANAHTTASLVVRPVAPGSVETPNPLSLITAKQFLSLTPRNYEALTGKKLNLVQKVQFKYLQYRVKKMVKKGQVVTMADVAEELGTMNVLGFLLGLVLGPVGVVIALILKETGNVDASVLRWSLYGLLVWLAIVLVAILI
jgi:hypothetical protein